MTVIEVSTKSKLFNGSKDQCMWWADIKHYKVIDVDSVSRTVWVQAI